MLLCVTYTVASFAIHPSVGVDPAYSLRVYQSMQAGAPWNHLLEPDARDISRDVANFFAMFSPGAYLVPALGMKAGMSMGAAASMVSVIVTLLGLFGWFRLFRVLEIDRRAALIACLILAASRSVNLAFITYLGGEILAFAAFPFLAAEMVRLRRSRWLPLFAVVAIIVGFTAKNSLAIYLAAWIGAQAATAIWPRQQRPPALIPSVLAVVAAGVTMVIIEMLFVSRGWSPLSYQPSIGTSMKAYLLPWSMPILAATSWDDVFSWVFLHPSGALIPFDYRTSIPFIGVIAVVSIAAAVLAARRDRNEHIAHVFLYSMFAVGALTLLLASGAIASLDLSRHYRVVGYVWLPFMVTAVLRSRTSVAAVLAITLALPCAYGASSFAANWRRSYVVRASESERLRIAHPQITPRLARGLAKLDAELPPGSLVVTPVPTYALEFMRTRALATNVVADDISRMPQRHGRATNLILIADLRAMGESKRAQWLALFTDYERWQWFDLDEHRFYVPEGQPVDPAWVEAELR